MTDGTLIVTGAARGIGATIAIHAARRGYRVAVNYSADAAGAREVVARIRGEGGRAVAIPADIAEEGDVLRLFEVAEQNSARSPPWSTMPASRAASPGWTRWKRRC